MSVGAADWLPAATVMASGRPVLSAGEIERHLLPLVDLEPEENPRLAPLRGCLLVLTSHRLVFLHEASLSARALPLASIIHTYPPHRRHNHSPLRSLFSSSSSSSSSHHPRIRIQISLPLSRSEVVAVVVTCKADVDVFYGRLLEVIRTRAWEATASAAPASGAPVAEGAAPAEEDLAIRMPVVGVAGILRKEQETWESAGQNLQDAFQDLNALMSKAKEMMELAEKMRQKLLTNSSAQSNSNDEEMGSKQDLQDLLLSVRIVSSTLSAIYKYLRMF
ncbi:vacuolar protein sorting-associated protein 36-like [Triticum urartu]|uniref:vacuolar protein sorting-associated protein 36-like n=1 Tax=Triticum urartu TaxID=4572 RepID=UPI002042CBD5|nr:vacuolar protein sorting-associated protein 36-like [Triticum urartu]